MEEIDKKPGKMEEIDKEFEAIQKEMNRLAGLLIPVKPEQLIPEKNKQGGDKNMRTVRIPNLDYEDYAAIMDAIDEVIPFAVLETRYNKRLRYGIFNFWDSDYIPSCMEEFIMRPPTNRENVLELQYRLVEAMKQIIMK